MLDWKHSSRRFHTSVICSINLITGSRVHIIINNYPGGKLMRETISTKVWRNGLRFLHHSCPAPDVVLTHSQTSFEKLLEDWSSPQGSRRAHNLHQQLQTSTIGSPHNMDKPSTSWTVWYWPLVMLEILTSSSYNAKRLSTFKNVIFSPVQSYIHIKYAHYSLWWLWYEWHWSILCSRILTPVTRMINPFDFLSKLDLLSVSLLYLLLPTNIRKFLCDCSCQSKSWYHDDVVPKFYSNKLNQIYEKGDPPQHKSVWYELLIMAGNIFGKIPTWS